MLLAVSDQAVIESVRLVVEVVGGCFLAYITYLTARMKYLADEVNRKQDLAVRRVEEVKVDLEHSDAARGEQISAVTMAQSVHGDQLKAIHTLVNNNMAIQLRINAEQAQELANLKQTPEARHIADIAARALAEHEARQRQVDDAVETASSLKPPPAAYILKPDD